MVNIIEAMADPELFGPHFRPHKKHGDTWRRWRVFLKALFALPMDADDLVIYQQCTGRTDPPTEPVTEAALVVGRRGGKSRIVDYHYADHQLAHLHDHHHDHDEHRQGQHEAEALHAPRFVAM